MPDAAVRTVVERLDAVSVNMVPHPDGDGGLILQPSNYYYENWWWGEKEEWGDPVGWEIGVPPVHDGHNIFMTSRNGGRTTLVCQNFEPLGIQRPSFATTQPWVPGHSPATRDMGDRSGLAPPQDAPIITLEVPTKLGYRSGDWLLTYYYETKNGRKTQKAPGVIVTVPQGGRILVTLPQEHPENAYKITLCLGKAASGVSGTKPQKSWKVSELPLTYELAGPYRYGLGGSSHTEKNESKKGKASKPRAKKRHSRRRLKKAKRRRRRRRGGGGGGSNLAGLALGSSPVGADALFGAEEDEFEDVYIYEFVVVEVHANGDSLPSDPVELEVAFDEENTEIAIEPGDISDEAIGYKIFCNAGDGWYEVFTAHSESTSTQSKSINQTVTINGDEVKTSGTSSDSGASGARSTGSNTGSGTSSNTGNVQNVSSTSSGGGGGRKKKKRRRRRKEARKGPGGGGASGKSVSSTSMRSSSPTTTDQSGIEDPTSELEAPQVLASLNPITPGTYQAAFSRTRGEFESRIGPTRQFVIPADSSGVATRIAKLTLPHPINEIVNAEFQDVDSGDLPLDHIVSPGSGMIWASVGRLYLDTNGSRVTTDTPFHFSNVVQVQRTTDYWLHAKIDLPIYVNGSFQVVLNEYDIDNPTASTVPLRSTTLKSQDAGGESEYNQRMGPWGTEWHPQTVSAMILHRIAGSPRHLQANIYDWQFTSFKGGVRRYESTGGVYNPDPPEDTPLPRTSYKVISIPPSGTRKRQDVLVPSFIDVQRFSGTGAVPDPLDPDWHAQNYGSFSQGGSAAAAINSSFGYRFTKATTATGLGFTYFNPFGNTGGPNMAVRALFRSSDLNTRSGYYPMMIRDQVGVLAQNGWYERALAFLYRWRDGWMYAYVQDPSFAEWWYKQPLGVQWNAGDTMDIELVVLNAGIRFRGEVRVLIGKNGATRTLRWRKTGIDAWSNEYSGMVSSNAKQAVLGIPALDDWADTVVVDTDDWVVSHTGAPLVLDPPRPPLEPLPEMDRPLVTTPTVSQQYFETGSEAPGTLVRSHTTNTVAAVGTSYAINGSFGVRLSDTGSGQLSNISYREDLPTPRSSGAWRWTIRTVQRPSTGEICIAQLRSVTDFRMAEAILTSVGDLYIQLYTGANATHGPRYHVERNITNGAAIVLEVVAAGAGTEQGALQAFVKYGDGSRRMLLDEELIPWSDLTLWRAFVGGVRKSTTAVTYVLDIDDILVTERGSLVYEEFTENGEDIEQAYLLLQPGQPVLPGMFLHAEPVTVEPGEVYTVGIKARWAGIEEGGVSYPFHIVAYDLDGEKHDLGCLVDNDAFVDGAKGTRGWTHLTMTLPPIPARCFELAWESRDMQPGEYVAQSPSLSKGTEAKLSVTFPTTGSHRVRLDTNTPRSNDGLMPLGRTWRSFSAKHDPAEGCTVTQAAWGSDLASMADATPVQVDPALVPQRRYAWVEYQVQGDGFHTPEIPWKAPRVEYELDVSDCFLMEDDSEMPGGVVVGSDHPVEWQFYEKTHVIDLESGRVVRQPTSIGVGWMAPCKLQATSMLTMRFMTEWWLKRPWVVQTPTEKLVVMATKEITLEDWTETPGAYDHDNEGYVNSWYELDDTGRFEVIEVVPHPWLVPEDIAEITEFEEFEELLDEA